MSFPIKQRASDALIDHIEQLPSTPPPVVSKEAAAKKMLPYSIHNLKSLHAQVQAASITFRRAQAQILADRDLSPEGRSKRLNTIVAERTEKVSAVRKEWADAKASVDRQLAVIRARPYEERDSNGKLRREMEISRAWARIQPRLLRAAADPQRTAFAEALAVINEAKKVKDLSTLDALREELPAFIQNNEPAARLTPPERQLLNDGITISLDSAEAELSPDFHLAQRVAAEIYKGQVALNQSLNALEHQPANDPRPFLIHDWPDEQGKIEQLPV